MTIKEMFEKHDDEYLCFERIPADKRLAEVREMCSLLYIYKLMKDPLKFEIAAEHDIIYAALIQFLQELTEEDVIYLSRCGIHYNDEYEPCLAMFT